MLHRRQLISQSEPVTWLYEGIKTIQLGARQAQLTNFKWIFAVGTGSDYMQIDLYVIMYCIVKTGNML